MEIIEELQMIQDELRKEYPNFPNDRCSTSVERMYKRLGFIPEGGTVKTLCGEIEHSWGVKDGMLGDITLIQFSEEFGFKVPSIIFLPIGDAIVKYGYTKNEDVTKLLQREIFPYKRRPNLREYFSICSDSFLSTDS